MKDSQLPIKGHTLLGITISKDNSDIQEKLEKCIFGGALASRTYFGKRDSTEYHNDRSCFNCSGAVVIKYTNDVYEICADKYVLEARAPPKIHFSSFSCISELIDQHATQILLY